MVKHPLHIGLLHGEDIPEKVIADFVGDIQQDGLKVQVESRPLTPLAGIEWLLPTAVILFITRDYFGGFLREAGKDHYSILKGAIIKKWPSFFGENPTVSLKTVVSGEKKLRGTHSMSFSIQAQIENGQNLKLIFRKDISEDEYRNSINEFLKLLAEYNIEKSLPENAIVRSQTIVVEYNPEQKEIIFLDPYQSAKSQT